MSFSVSILVSILLIFLLELYFYKKLKKVVINLFPRINFKKFRLITWIALGYINIYPVLMFFARLYYSVILDQRPELPEGIWFDIFILFPFWVAALTMLQTVIYFLVLDIIKLLILPIYKRYKTKILPYEAKLLLVMIGFFIIYSPARIAYDYYFVSVRPVELVKKDLPPSLENFKIVFVSDIQADKYTNNKRLDNYISKINELNPDLVLMAGDIITGTPKYINLAAEYTGKIKSKYGVFTCVGDHDNWAYREDTKKSIREITAALGKKNVKMVDNGKEIINVNNADIGITFVTNTYVEKINPDILLNLVNGNKEHDLRIFLTHQPRTELILAATENKYDMFLAGHTHGGQVTFLFPFINLSPTLIETKYVRGTFYIDDMLMIVTRGLGMSLVPIRFNSTPEITVINVTGKR
ncbi:MAG: metallophosphoesterase [Ignavibacteriaceae bacterium]